MNTFELNKIFGAFLFAGLVAMTAWLISLAAFGKLEHGHHERVVHYQVEGLEADGASQAAEVVEDVVEEELSLASLLATADAADGQKAFKKCAACHTVDQGGKNKVGPNLWNIVNRPIAAVEGFSYSSAMASMEGVWDWDLLSDFIADPKGTVAGTKMAFRGVSKDNDRADLLSYLRSLSDAPADLPVE